MARLSNVRKSGVASVLQEFVDLMTQDGSIGFGAEKYITEVLEKALGKEKAERLVGRLREGDPVGIEAISQSSGILVADRLGCDNPGRF